MSLTLVHFLHISDYNCLFMLENSALIKFVNFTVIII